MDDVKQFDQLAAAEYEVDFYAWSMEQAALIRALSIPGLDVENVAEEIESLGRSDKRELESRFDVLLIHLLKWQFQPDRRGKSWQLTIIEQRKRIDVVLRESPSLKRTISTVIAKTYRGAVKQAAVEIDGLPETFPASCPWTPEEVLGEGWLPG